VPHDPEAVRGFERVKAFCRPPIYFPPGAMQFAVMCATKRNGEFVADLLSKSTRLCKTQMVRVARLAAADEAGLPGHKAQVLLVPKPLGLRQGQEAFVDAGPGPVDRRWLVQFG
jgi:hypothetical protein